MKTGAGVFMGRGAVLGSAYTQHSPCSRWLFAPSPEPLNGTRCAGSPGTDGHVESRAARSAYPGRALSQRRRHRGKCAKSPISGGPSSLTVAGEGGRSLDKGTDFDLESSARSFNCVFCAFHAAGGAGPPQVVWLALCCSWPARRLQCGPQRPPRERRRHHPYLDKDTALPGATARPPGVLGGRRLRRSSGPTRAAGPLSALPGWKLSIHDRRREFTRSAPSLHSHAKVVAVSAQRPVGSRVQAVTFYSERQLVRIRVSSVERYRRRQPCLV